MIEREEPAPLRVAAITPGRFVPSARYRVRQLIPALRANGVSVNELVPAVSAFPPEARWMRPGWGALALAARVPLVAASRRHELTLLQRELISTLVTLERFTGTPRVLDVDDAIFLARNGRSAARIAEMSDAVICGNAFLAEAFSRWNKNVTILPTAVDAVAYAPPRGGRNPEDHVIGWVGTRFNLRSLEAIEDALVRVLAACPRARVLVVSDGKPAFRRLRSEHVELRRWSPEAERRALDEMSVGIMPLEDSPWARGKCSFKMLSYMACGLPVAASPVGMNAQIFALGSFGVATASSAEWVDGLVSLLRDPSLREAMGAAGRSVVEREFSVSVIAPRLATQLLRIAGREVT